MKYNYKACKNIKDKHLCIYDKIFIIFNEAV